MDNYSYYRYSCLLLQDVYLSQAVAAEKEDLEKAFKLYLRASVMANQGRCQFGPGQTAGLWTAVGRGVPDLNTTFGAGRCQQLSVLEQYISLWLYPKRQLFILLVPESRIGR